MVNVASRAHKKGSLDLDDLFFKRRKTFGLPLIGPFIVYGTSKLLNILFTTELARRLKEQGSKVTTNCLHPGLVRTGFGRDYGGLFNLATRVFGLVSITPEEGAQTGLYLSTSPEVEGLSGGYYSQCEQIQANPDAVNPEYAARLWALSEELCAEYM